MAIAATERYTLLSAVTTLAFTLHSGRGARSTCAHVNNFPPLPPHPILWLRIYPVIPTVITLGSPPPASRTSLLPFVMLAHTPASHIRGRPRGTHIAAASVALERRDQRIARPP